MTIVVLAKRPVYGFCVICLRPLRKPLGPKLDGGREHVDVCGDRCFGYLLERRRGEIYGEDRIK